MKLHRSAILLLSLALLGCEKQPEVSEEEVPLDMQMAGAAAAWNSNLTLFGHMPFEQTRAMAEKGDAGAQLQMALYYQKGIGALADPAEAARWLRKAADQGNLTAQIYLADNYFTGTGVKKDAAQAMMWSQLVLSNEQATPWCGFLATQGVTSAELFLANCYASGHHLDRDSDSAVKWYREAAHNGNAEAQFRLGICYSQGWGVDSNAEYALDWFQKAADQGHPGAESLLGGAYASGDDDLTNDLAEAYKWLSLAVSNEWRPDARTNDQTMLDFVKARMRPKEKAEGERRVTDFMAQ